MFTQAEYAAAHREARHMSEINAQPYIVDPDTLEVLWVEDYTGDLDPEEIYYCGRKYDLAE